MSPTRLNGVEDAHPEALVFSKAEFAVLLERVIGAPFTLDTTALHDLALDDAAVRTAEQSLIARGLYAATQSAATEPVASMLRTMLGAGWKAIVQIKGRTPHWRQLALHLVEGSLLGEGIRLDESRLFVPLADEAAAATWLLSMTVGGVPTSTLARETRRLEALLPQAEQLAVLVLANSATNEAREALIWLVAEGRLWLVERDSGREARAISAFALTKALQRRLETVMIL